MSLGESSTETEIKLRVPGATQALALLETHRFLCTKPRLFEINILFDTPEESLRHSGTMLRLRTLGDSRLLTWKGIATRERHKSREELEVAIVDAPTFELILARLGYTPSFRYEKFRTEFSDQCGHGFITLDETPVGTFLELEGEAAWIDRTAGILGFQESDYVLHDYGWLYLEYCRQHGAAPSNMVFACGADSGNAPAL